MSSSTLTIIQTQLTLYGYSISMILGNIGNVFIVILFNRQQQSACSIYLISSAIVNSVYLLFLGFIQLFPFTYTNPTTAAFVLCKLAGYIPSVLGQVPKNIIVLACIDRYMITNHRATFRALSTPKRAKHLVFFSTILCFLLPAHRAVMQTINNGQCGTFGIYASILIFYLLIVLGLMPPILCGIFGHLTYRNMNRLRTHVQPIAQNTNVENTHIRRRDRELLVIVISEVVVYIITSIPYPFILLETMISNYVIVNKNIQYRQVEGFVTSVAYLLLFINSAAPFYTYLVSSKPFRQDFNRLIINNYRKLRGHQVNPTILGMGQTNTQRETRV